ncbi:MAG: hypothetical protein U0599_24940 [Vicinamibacteria bacterium]
MRRRGFVAAAAAAAAGALRLRRRRRSLSRRTRPRRHADAGLLLLSRGSACRSPNVGETVAAQASLVSGLVTPIAVTRVSETEVVAVSRVCTLGTSTKSFSISS